MLAWLRDLTLNATTASGLPQYDKIEPVRVNAN
jgi:hypothetical protein